MSEGYRTWDSPVAMPELGAPKTGLTLEEYFHNLEKFHKEDSAKDKQVAGTHYQRAIQPWDIISEWELDFWRGNVLKYILRAPLKGKVEDLQKARHYLDYLIENYDTVFEKV